MKIGREMKLKVVLSVGFVFRHFPMSRLAEQFDTIAWLNSLAEQNWRTWPPSEWIFFGRTEMSFDRKKLLTSC